jgi:serine/threonine-protein kinase HipA
MIDAAAVDILFRGRRIFTFDEAYLADEDRATLSLACRDLYGRLSNG